MIIDDGKIQYSIREEDDKLYYEDGTTYDEAFHKLYRDWKITKKVLRAVKDLDAPELENEFYDFLDDNYEMINVGGYDYNYSHVWKSVDPISWEVAVSDYHSQLIADQEEIIDTLANDMISYITEDGE